MDYAKKTDELIAALAALRIVPVLVLENLDDGLKMCETLLENGLRAAEITFRTTAAASVIQAAATRFPELLLGAGTVLNVENLQRGEHWEPRLYKEIEKRDLFYLFWSKNAAASPDNNTAMPNAKPNQPPATYP